MAIKSLQHSSLTDNIFYRSLLAGNAAFNPSDEDILAEQVLSSSAASVTFSGLDAYAADYQHLQIRGVVARSGSGSIANAYVKLNGSDRTSAHILGGSGSGSPYSFVTSSPRTWQFSGTGDEFTAFVLDILDPFETTKNKTTRMFAGSVTGESLVQLSSSFLNSTGSLTSVVIGTDALFQTESRFTLIGLK